jgi:hypothetical protein
MSRFLVPFALLLGFVLAACSTTPRQACEASCAQDVRCDEDSFAAEEGQDACVESCLGASELIEDWLGAECRDAWADRMQCVSRLSCTGEEKWADGDPDDSYAYPCKAADNREIETCTEGGGDDDDGGGCDCSVVSMNCSYTYDSYGNATEHCTCSPSCCC